MVEPATSSLRRWFDSTPQTHHLDGRIPGWPLAKLLAFSTSRCPYRIAHEWLPHGVDIFLEFREMQHIFALEDRRMNGFFTNFSQIRGQDRSSTAVNGYVFGLGLGFLATIRVGLVGRTATKPPHRGVFVA